MAVAVVVAVVVMDGEFALYCFSLSQVKFGGRTLLLLRVRVVEETGLLASPK